MLLHTTASKQFLFNYSIWLTRTINQVFGGGCALHFCCGRFKVWALTKLCLFFGYKTESSLTITITTSTTTKAYVYQSEFYPSTDKRNKFSFLCDFFFFFVRLLNPYLIFCRCPMTSVPYAYVTGGIAWIQKQQWLNNNNSNSNGKSKSNKKWRIKWKLLSIEEEKLKSQHCA